MNNSYAQSGMHTPVLLSIAASIEPAFPNAADTLRGIADQIADGAEAARPATLAASEASRVLGEGSDAREAREAAFAETALEALCLTLHPERPDRVCRECQDFALTGLRAEVAGLEADLTKFAGFGDPVARAEAAERARDAALAEVTELRDRLGRVEAEALGLIDLLDQAYGETCTPSRGCTGCELLLKASKLRAALAVPVTGDTEDASPAAEDAPRADEHAGGVEHRVVSVWQERPREVSWRCCCGFVSKHMGFPDGEFGVVVPECPDATAIQSDQTGEDMCPNCITPWKCNGPHDPTMSRTGAASPTEQATEGGAK